MILISKKNCLLLHPSGPNPYVPGAHRLHFLPTTFGLHEHWPPRESQIALVDPVGSHWHAKHSRYEITIECIIINHVTYKMLRPNNKNQYCSDTFDKRRV